MSQGLNGFIPESTLLSYNNASALLDRVRGLLRERAESQPGGAVQDHSWSNVDGKIRRTVAMQQHRDAEQYLTKQTRAWGASRGWSTEQLHDLMDLATSVAWRPVGHARKPRPGFSEYKRKQERARRRLEKKAAAAAKRAAGSGGETPGTDESKQVAAAAAAAAATAASSPGSGDEELEEDFDEDEEEEEEDDDDDEDEEEDDEDVDGDLEDGQSALVFSQQRGTYSRMSFALLLSAVPSGKVSSKTIVMVCSRLFGLFPRVQVSVLRWLRQVFHVLTPRAKQVMHRMYSLFFACLEYEMLRAHASHLLFMLTRKQDVLPFRRRRLTDLVTGAGAPQRTRERWLQSLFLVYESYAARGEQTQLLQGKVAAAPPGHPGTGTGNIPAVSDAISGSDPFVSMLTSHTHGHQVQVGYLRSGEVERTKRLAAANKSFTPLDPKFMNSLRRIQRGSNKRKRQGANASGSGSGDDDTNSLFDSDEDENAGTGSTPLLSALQRQALAAPFGSSTMSSSRRRPGRPPTAAVAAAAAAAAAGVESGVGGSGMANALNRGGAGLGSKNPFLSVSKESLVPQISVANSVRDQGSVSFAQLASVEQLVQALPRLELPAHLSSVLGNRMLQHWMTLNPSIGTMYRIRYWIRAFTDQQMAERSAVESEMFDAVVHLLADFTDAMHETLPEIEDFVFSMLEGWDGHQHASAIFRILSWLPPRSFSELQVSVLSPLASVFATAQPAMQRQIILLLTRMIIRWSRFDCYTYYLHVGRLSDYHQKNADVQHAVSRKATRKASHYVDAVVTPDDAVLESIQKLILFVDSMLVSAMMANDHHPLIASTALEFAEDLTTLFGRERSIDLGFQQPVPVLPFVALPSQYLTYACLMSDSADDCSRMCGVILGMFHAVSSIRAFQNEIQEYYDDNPDNPNRRLQILLELISLSVEPSVLIVNNYIWDALSMLWFAEPFKPNSNTTSQLLQDAQQDVKARVAALPNFNRSMSITCSDRFAVLVQDFLKKHSKARDRLVVVPVPAKWTKKMKKKLVVHLYDQGLTGIAQLLVHVHTGLKELKPSVGL